MAAVDLFLKLDGIPGESTDRDHPGQIEVEAFGWAEHLALATGGGSGGGSGTGKVQMGDLQLIMRTSIASPALLLACATGRHVRTATLSARRPGGDRPRDHLVIRLTDVVVTTYRVGADESGDHTEPTDQVSLSFAAIEYTYVPARADGGAGTPVTVSWDRVRNAPAKRAAARATSKAATSKAATSKAATSKAAAAKAGTAAKKKPPSGRAR